MAGAKDFECPSRLFNFHRFPVNRHAYPLIITFTFRVISAIGNPISRHLSILEQVPVNTIPLGQIPFVAPL
jgi:hypothetical protein